MIDQIKIGKFIAAKRKEKSLTQAEVAEKLGITLFQNGREDSPFLMHP